MASTFLELTNNVLKRLNQVELNSSSFPAARGIHATAKMGVNNALKKINTQKFEWPFNATQGVQVLTPGTNFYNFPTNLKVIDWDSFYLEKDDTLGITTKNLQAISKDEWFKYMRQNDLNAGANGKGVPDVIFDYGNKSFGVSPVPNRAYELNYRYFTKVVDLSLYSDDTNVPEEYNYVIEDGAVHYCYMMMDNEQRAMSAEALFRQGIADMVSQYLPHDPYAYATVVNQGGRFYNEGSGFYWGE